MARGARLVVTEPDMGQLPLALALADHARFDTFVPGANGAALRHLGAVAAGDAATLWLTGPLGSGKSHLLQAACRAAAAAGRRTIYLPLGAPALEPAVLTGLEDVELVALDDLERVAGQSGWERALFVLLDEAPQRGTGLLLAAERPAGGCGFELPDLVSRASAAFAYRLKPLTDAERLEALLAHAAARGLTLERAAAEYLLQRVERNMSGVTSWLDRLDRESLVTRRKITIPFIRALLAEPAHGA